MRTFKNAARLGIVGAVTAGGLALAGAPSQAAVDCQDRASLEQGGIGWSFCTGLSPRQQHRVKLTCLYVAGGGAYVRYGTYQGNNSYSNAYCLFNGIAINSQWELYEA